METERNKECKEKKSVRKDFYIFEGEKNDFNYLKTLTLSLGQCVSVGNQHSVDSTGSRSQLEQPATMLWFG